MIQIIKRTRWLILFMVLAGYGQVKYSGWHYGEFSRYTDREKNYYESWTEFLVRKNNLEAGLRFQNHTPPQPFSLEKEGSRFSQYFVRFSNKFLKLSLGTFYGIMGRGLVFQSFENRTIRWDTNVMGGKLDWNYKKLRGSLMIGKPRDRAGNRIEMLYGGSVSGNLFRKTNLGINALTTETIDNSRQNWGSVFLEHKNKFSGIYGEIAASRNNQFPERNGHALFLALDAYLTEITFHAEYKNYHRFALSYGSLYNYNNLPLAFKEHVFTLLNRKQHLVNGNNEAGYLFEFSGPMGEVANWLINYSRTENRQGREMYREWYGQFEYFPSDRVETIMAAGLEYDLEARYINLVMAPTYYINYTNSVKLQLEHQHEKIKLTKRQFYNQLFTLTYSNATGFSLSVVAERTTDQFSEKDMWIGGQLDVNLIKNLDLSVFGGSRREGKICVGGVCVHKPEFEGLELIINYRFH
ncbi:MAG: hypothetical protein Kow00108_12660 [Calditrichia bacterium]